MTTETPRPYASHLEAHEHHEDRLPDLCRRGLHLMEGDNVMRRGDGGRQCRACKAERRQEWLSTHRDEEATKRRARYERDPEPVRRRRRVYYDALRRCRRGHVQDGKTEYVRPDGRRECRRCRRRYQATWRARRQETA